MKRRQSNLAAALSLLLSVAIIILWWRSLTVGDWISYTRATAVNGRYARTEWIALSSWGFVGITKADTVPKDDASAAWLRDVNRRDGLGWTLGPASDYPFSWRVFVGGLRRLGVSSGIDYRDKFTLRRRSIEVPYWLLLLVVSFPGWLALLRFVRSVRARRRAAESRCPTCGYDLRATPERCPECGAVPAVK